MQHLKGELQNVIKHYKVGGGESPKKAMHNLRTITKPQKSLVVGKLIIFSFEKIYLELFFHLLIDFHKQV